MEATSVTLNKSGFHQTYVLRYQREEAAHSPRPDRQRFVVYPAADAAHSRNFDSIEQVMDFLLDELFGSGGRDKAELNAG